MPYGLERWQDSEQSHFLTFSCYQRRPYFSSHLRDLFLVCLERTRRLYQFRVYGFVVMPEHVHLLVSEPKVNVLATAIQALKVSFVRRSESLRETGTFWQKRYYDHNVRDYESFTQKLRYIHRNPVKRGLCATAMGWKWSSCRHYATSEIGIVEIESEWTADRRSGREPHVLGTV
jgi:putative transposase